MHKVIKGAVMKLVAISRTAAATATTLGDESKCSSIVNGPYRGLRNRWSNFDDKIVAIEKAQF